jgi:hypothetical protein
MFSIHCSIIGAVIIALGLYTVVWGKAKDYSESDTKLPSSTIEEETKSMPITAIDDPKIDIIAVNLENQPPPKDEIVEPNKLEKEAELYVAITV